MLSSSQQPTIEQKEEEDDMDAIRLEDMKEEENVEDEEGMRAVADIKDSMV